MTGHDDTTGRALPGTEEALVARLRALSPAATPDEDFRAATRTRLVAMAAVRTPAGESARRPPVRESRLRRLLSPASGAPSSGWHSRLTAGLAGAALTVTALGGLLGAAQGARPGDLLYDLKRGGEQTQLALAGDSGRGSTLLDFATTRLDELQELVGVDASADAVVGSLRSGGEAGVAAGPDPDLVLQTLQTMDEQTAEGTAALTEQAVQESDAAALDTLAGWAADQQDGLDAVVGAVPAGTEDALTDAQDLVARVATRATDLQAALDCAGGPSVQGADELGPVPAPCAASPSTAGGTDPGSSSVSVTGPSGAAGTTGAEPAGSVAASGTAAATSATPTTAAPGTTTGGAQSSESAPTTSAQAGLPLPSIPLTIGSPATTSTAAPLLSVPTLVPGLQVCLPPAITVGC